MDLYSANFSQGNTTTTSQLTDLTVKSYENDPQEILLTPGRHGPFFRVDGKDFVVEETNALLRLNRNHIIYVRGAAIRGYLLEAGLVTKDLEDLLESSKEEIEMDPEFGLLNQITTKVLPGHHQKLNELYKRTSRGRWVGLTQPVDFEEAHRLYYLKPYIGNRTRSHLFKFYIDVPKSSDHKPVAFFEKVKNGSSFQFKFNNASMECTVEIEEIKKARWPYEHQW